jgi:polar amino acid transport system substrate-binding protein
MTNRHPLFALLACLLAAPACADPGEVIVPLVNYYDYAPFSMPQERADLTRELADLLTAGSAGRYRFVPTLLPKGRLDQMLQHGGWQGMVAWLNPRFVNDETKSRYVWTKALMQETDLVVSRVDAPVEFTGVQSLRGKVLGTVLNQRYADVEDMIASEQLRRSDAPSQENSVRKLLLKRVDVVFISRSTLNGLHQRVPEFDNKLHVSAQPRNSFTRHIMLTPGLPPELIRYVQTTAAKLDSNPSWRDIAARYHIAGQIEKN